MNIRKAIFAVCFTSLAGAAYAGPMVSDASAHAPGMEHSAAASPFAELTLHDGSAQRTADPLDAFKTPPASVTAVADPGHLVYDSSHFGTSTIGVAMPPATTAAGISEPATLALLGAGLIGLAMLRRHR